MANKFVICLIIFVSLFQVYLSEVCYVSNCLTCRSTDANYCFTCNQGYYVKYGKCFSGLSWYNILIIIMGFLAIVGLIIRCCCYRRPAADDAVVVISSPQYQPPQPAPTITTTRTTINNTNSVPMYNSSVAYGAGYNPNQYSNPNVGNQNNHTE